jgi:hypothetical protein
MPALKPQSSVNNASYVAAGGLFPAVGPEASRSGGRSNGLCGKRFSTSAKLYRHSVFSDREPKAHLLKASVWDSLFRGQANVTWRTESDIE